uniref:Zinc finger protein 511 n=1 Tax=Sphenodon punctatus TaxID=8508 RepID=A0A8D0G8I9_SPHPU
MSAHPTPQDLPPTVSSFPLESDPSPPDLSLQSPSCPFSIYLKYLPPGTCLPVSAPRPTPQDLFHPPVPWCLTPPSQICPFSPPVAPPIFVHRHLPSVLPRVPSLLPIICILFQDGDVLRHLYLQDILTRVTVVTERPRVSEFCCHMAGCGQFFDTLESYEHHYNTLHTNVCSSCKRAFPSGRLLDIHILEWHDSLFQIMAEKQDMYQCLTEGCVEKFKSSKERKDHLVRVHLYPSDFRFDKPKKAKR